MEDDPVLEYEKALQSALQEAKAKNVGIHSSNPLVRTLKSAGEDFQVLELVEKSNKLCDGGAVTCLIEHVFDGSKLRVLVTDASMAKAGLQYAYYTLIIAGITSPRMGNPRADPPVESEPLADDAREFVESRLLQRELKVILYGLDKPGLCAVGSPLHPRGNIAVELLKNGLARMCDWSSRLMNPLDLPAMRVAENAAKVSPFLFDFS
jgi:staphylococcal nuclease domain-containing protein 1